MTLPTFLYKVGPVHVLRVRDSRESWSCDLLRDFWKVMESVKVRDGWLGRAYLGISQLVYEVFSESIISDSFIIITFPGQLEEVLVKSSYWLTMVNLFLVCVLEAVL